MVRVYTPPKSCRTSYFYDLGGAHQVKSAKNQKEFDDKFRRIQSSINYVCITTINTYQKKTKEYMEKQGWEFKNITPRLLVGTISKGKLNRYLTSATYPKEEILPTSRFAPLKTVQRKQPIFTKRELREYILEISGLQPAAYEYIPLRIILSFDGRRELRQRLINRFDIRLPEELSTIGHGEIDSLFRSVVTRIANRNRNANT